MVIKLPIPYLKNTNPQFKITDWLFYHHLVISTFISLISPGAIFCLAICADIVRWTEIRVAAPILKGAPLLLDLLDVLLGQPFHVLV